MVHDDRPYIALEPAVDCIDQSPLVVRLDGSRWRLALGFHGRAAQPSAGP
jgi:hypothetical protein